MGVEVPAIRLRPATAADYDFTRRVHHAGMRWIAERLFGPWNDDAQDKKFRQQFVLADVRIVALGTETVGYLQLEVGADELFLRELHIGAAFQNRGIGTDVLRLVLAEAERHGKPVIVAVVKFNPARALYERCGFRTFREDEYKFYMRAGASNPRAR